MALEEFLAAPEKLVFVLSGRGGIGKSKLLQAFAGRAFRWQDAPTPLEPAGTRLFQSAATADSGPVIAFTRPGG